MEKTEPSKQVIKKFIQGRFSKRDFARLLLGLAPHVTDWGHLRAILETEETKKSIERIKEATEADKKMRPDKRKTGRPTKRTKRHTKEEWKKFKNRERVARHRARKKQEREIKE